MLRMLASAATSAEMYTGRKHPRLKLDIKPVKQVVSEKEILEILQFVFNYNVDLEKANAVEEIAQTLRRWSEARDCAKEIISSLESWQWK